MSSDANQRILPRVDPWAPVPCGSAQRRLWFLQQLTPASGSAYDIAAAFRITGGLDQRALTEALRVLAERHEALRTRIVARDGEPVQLVGKEIEPPIRTAECDPAEPDRLESLVRAELSRSFDPTAAPLWRVLVIRLTDQDHVLTFCASHLICDGWSLGVFFDELEPLYAAEVAGRPWRPAPLTVQYPDFAEWEREWLRDPTVDAELTAWAEELADTPATAPAADHPRPRLRRYRGARTRVEIPPATAKAVTAAAERLGATKASVYLAAYQILLARHTGEPEVVVGMPVAGRTRTELEPLVGFLASTVPVRADLSGDPTGAAVVAAARRATHQALTRAQLPFDGLVERLRPDRDTSRTPVFQCFFAYQNAPDRGLRLAGAEVTRFPVTFGTTRFDLTLEVFEPPGRTYVDLEYDTDLYLPSTVDRLAEHYLTLVGGLAEDEHTPAWRLPLTDPTGRPPATTGDSVRVTGPATLDARLAAQAELTPTAPCLVTAEGDLRYDAFWQRARQLAGRLRAHGVRPNEVVAVRLDRGATQVVALAGTLAAGGAYLPLDPGHPPARTRAILDQARPRVVITTTAHAAGLTGDGPAVLCLDDLADLDGTPEPPTWPAPHPDDLAYVIFTSGSTGEPKGAMISHRAIVNRLAWMQAEYGLRPTDRVLQKTPFTFDVSVWEYFWPLTVGAQLVVAPPDAHRDPAALTDLMARHAITHVHFVPTMLAEVLAHELDLPDLRAVFCSGEELPPDLAARAVHRFGAQVHNLYGPTEAAVDVTHHHCQDPAALARVPIGRPVANTSVHVLDSALNPVPVGVPGELYLSGVQLARGYLGQPGLTAAAFVPAPDGAPGERRYRTGDLVRRVGAGDELEFLGRVDSQVKVRGQRVELGEIEVALRRHPEVANAAVAPRDLPNRPGTLVGYLTLTPEPAGAAPDRWTRVETEVRELIAERLPAAMIPAILTVLDALPLTTSGKVDRRRLPDPPARRTVTGQDHEPPRTDAEHAVAQVWSDLLGVDQVGVQDNFFTLGGDSILAMQVVGRLRDRGHAVPLRIFFEGATVERVAAAATPLADADPARDAHPVPLTAAQTWLLHPAARLARHLVLRTTWRHPFSQARLERALRAVVRAQPALRLRVSAQDGTGHQRLGRPDAALDAVARLRWLDHEPADLLADLDALTGPGLTLAVVNRPGLAEQDAILVLDRLLVTATSAGEIGAALDRALSGDPADPSAIDPDTADQLTRDRLRQLAAGPGPARPVVPTFAPRAGADGRLAEPTGRRLVTEVPTWYRCTAAELLTAATGALLAGAAPIAVQVDDPDRPAGLAGPWQRHLAVDLDPADSPLARLRTAKARLRAATSPPDGGDPAPVLLVVRDRTRPTPATGWTADQTDQDELFTGHAVVVVAEVDAAGLAVSVRCLPERTVDPAELVTTYLDAVTELVATVCQPGQDLYLASDFPAGELTDADRTWLATHHPRLADLYPLSPIQHTAVPLIARRSLAGAYVITIGMRLVDTGFDPAAFRRTWHTLMHRHSALRTSFVTVPGAGWRQAVHADPPLPVEDRDLRELPPDQREREVTALLDATQRHRFDPAAAPQWRITVLRVADDDYRLVVRLSYALQDGWSFAVLQEEWFALYRALRDGQELALPTPVPFRRHQEWLARQDHSAAREHWQGALRNFLGAAQVLDLPADYRLPSAGTAPTNEPTNEPPYQSVSVRMSRLLEHRLRTVGRTHRLTLFTLLTAGWAATLARASGSDRVAFGTLSSGRSPQVAGMERIFGPINNILPTVVRLPVGPDPLPWLHQLQHEHLRIREFDYSRMPEIGPWIGAPAGQPLVDNFLVFENFPRQPWLGEEMRVWNPEVAETQTEHTVRMMIWPSAPLAFHLSFYREHLEPAAAAGMLQEYLARLTWLADQLAGQPR